VDKLIAMVREAAAEVKGTVVYVPQGELPHMAVKGIWYFWKARQGLEDVLLALERSQYHMQEAARQMAKKEE